MWRIRSEEVRSTRHARDLHRSHHLHADEGRAPPAPLQRSRSTSCTRQKTESGQLSALATFLFLVLDRKKEWEYDRRGEGAARTVLEFAGARGARYLQEKRLPCGTGKPNVGKANRNKVASILFSVLRVIPTYSEKDRHHS